MSNNKDDLSSALSEIKFYAVVLNAAGDYGVETFDTLEELRARMAALVNSDVSAFSFVGQQLKISKPPYRHLLTPWGDKPLFVIPEKLEPDDSGYLGADPAHLEEPPDLPVQKRPGVASSDDEFFPEDDDNAFNVFDKLLPDPDS